MNLRTLIWAGATAYTSFKLVYNRQKIAKEYRETKALVDQTKRHLDHIQQSLGVIQSHLPTLQKVGSDFNYKLQVFQKETQAHLAQMPLLQNLEPVETQPTTE